MQIFPGISYDLKRIQKEQMPLRDWFAGQALSGIMMHDGRQDYVDNYQDMAADAYQVADAMLEARDPPAVD